ncbi:hypothetical protein, partial [Ruminococcus flavefaciens]|uniref:hypothetical protein n=1 Tax=Ruminococcus flavefaciens TaxID=1265 RepID=UPI0026EC09E0
SSDSFNASSLNSLLYFIVVFPFRFYYFYSTRFLGVCRLLFQYNTSLYPIVYETLHKISYHDKKKEWAFSGLQINEKNVVTNSNSKYKNKDLFSLHTGMNEGVTQMYAERIMRNDLHNNNFKSNIYKPQAEAMQYFENIYDPQKLKDAYIRNGFNDIEKDFDSIIGKTELSYLSKFIDLMDDSIECRGEVFKIIDDYAYRKEKMEQLSELLK